MTTYIQLPGRKSTLDHWVDMLRDNNHASFAAFAYVTDSGVAQLQTHLKQMLGEDRVCRWIFGIDYGRSQPSAIRRIASITSKTEVRIFRGASVVKSKGFAPECSFHLKTVVTHSESGAPYKQLVGSGNLSASGLVAGVEAGCVLDFDCTSPISADPLDALEKLWGESVPFTEVIEDYEAAYLQSFPSQTVSPEKVIATSHRLFWIDVGYVTKNRGPSTPGNQFDLPKGAHTFLGLKQIENPQVNTVLGELAFIMPSGETVSRNLRFGDNSMEKLSLPTPESYGFDCYDGKILIFNVHEDGLLLEAMEYEDFLRVYSHRNIQSTQMRSGRRYGTVEL